MGDTVPFPKNYERFVSLGQKAVEDQNFTTAIHYLLEAYQIKQTFSINLLLVSCYFELGEYTNALQYIAEFEKDYEKNIETFSFHMETLIAASLFIEAHRKINQRLFQNNKEEFELLITLKKEARRSELLFKQFEKAKVMALKEEILLLSNKHNLEQLSQVKIARHLPQDDFIEVAKILLLSQEIHPLVKSWFLENLVAMNVHEKLYTLAYDGKQRLVDIEELSLPYEYDGFIQIMHRIEEELGQNDPILMVNLVEEIKLFFASIYPFSEEIIREPMVWANSFLLTYVEGFEDHLSLEEMEQINKIRRVRDEIQNAMTF